MKKIICAVLVALMALNAGFCACARTATEYHGDDLFGDLSALPTVSLVDGNLDINAKSAVLIEPQTLTVLYESNGDEKLPPASITKIMSLLLIMEAIDEGKLTLETVINTSEYAASMGGSQIWLEPGEKMSLDEMLKAIVIASANDATVAVAEHIAGSEKAFVELMNKRAAELSMENTHFVNCTGLDADGHLTTAYDVALMSSALIKHELITKYSTVWMDTLRGGESELVNTNKLVRFYDGCIGLKTGTTSIAGHCLSAAAKRDGITLIAVVMKGADSNARFAGARALLDFGFANYSLKTVSAELGKDTFVKVKGGVKQSLKVKEGEPLAVLWRKGNPEVVRQVMLKENLKAPIKKGEKIGEVIISLDGEEVGVVPLSAAEGVKKRRIGTVFGWLLKGIVSF